MCITDHHDMTLAVKVALNPNTTNQLTNNFNDFADSFGKHWEKGSFLVPYNWFFSY